MRRGLLCLLFVCLVGTTTAVDRLPLAAVTSRLCHWPAVSLTCPAVSLTCPAVTDLVHLAIKSVPSALFTVS